MKKNVLAIIILMSLAFSVIAQETTLKSKRGSNILPEKGEFAIGVDASPFFNYLGNIFRITDNQNDSPSFNFLNNQSISGKYFISDKKAIRASIRFGIENETRKNQIRMNGGDIEEFVIDSWKASNTNIELLGGMEFRRGKGRVQGFYGAEAFLGYASMKNTYEYGNEFSALYPTPLSTIDWFGNQSFETSERLLETKNGSTFYIGAQAFVGVEYFIAPKMSLAGEFAWGPTFYNNMDNSVEKESYEEVTGVTTTPTEYPMGNSFSWNARNSNGKIAFLFYF